MGSKINPGRFDCYAAALIDEPVFVFLARDLLAPDVLMVYANHLEGEIEAGKKPVEDHEKVAEVRSCVADMVQWREMAVRFPGGPRWRVEVPAPVSDEGFRHAARVYVQELMAKLQRAEAEATALRMQVAESDARIETLESQDRVSAANIERLRLQVESLQASERPETISVTVSDFEQKRTETVLGIIRANAASIRQILFGEPIPDPEPAPTVKQFEDMLDAYRRVGEAFQAAALPMRPHRSEECKARDPDGDDDLGAPHELAVYIEDKYGQQLVAYHDCSTWNYGTPDQHRAGAEVRLNHQPVRWRLFDSETWIEPAAAEAEWLPPTLTSHPRAEDLSGRHDPHHDEFPFGRQLEP